MINNCEEIKIILHDYVDDKLEFQLRHDVEAHLRSCQTCMSRYEKITDMLESLKDLQDIVILPVDIREKMSNELLKKSLNRRIDETPLPRINPKKLKKEQAKLEKELKRSRFVTKKIIIPQKKFTILKLFRTLYWEAGLTVKRFFFVIAPLVIIGLIFLVADFMKINSPWEIEWRYGKYSINGSEEASLKLGKNDVLATDDSSHIIVYVPQTGRLEMYSNTNIKLIKPKNGDNRIFLSAGKIKMITTASVPYFKVEMGKNLIRVIGGVFTVNKLNSGGTNVFVDFGMIEIKSGDKYIFVDEGYHCDILSGKPPGTPYRFDATDSLKIFIKNFDDGINTENSLDQIISRSTKTDALTLLALIPKSSPIKRQVLFQKLSNFFPPPQNVTRMGIVALDINMLEAWWNEIEWQI